MISNQEAFDKVARHLLTQKRKSIGSKGGCCYRTNEGLRCAIGCLIPDELYDRRLEGFYVSELRELLRKIINNPHMGLLSELQHIHDQREVEDWEPLLRDVAVKFKLSTEVLNA